MTKETTPNLLSYIFHTLSNVSTFPRMEFIFHNSHGTVKQFSFRLSTTSSSFEY